jgi:hypothetical protein
MNEELLFDELCTWRKQAAKDTCGEGQPHQRSWAPDSMALHFRRRICSADFDIICSAIIHLTSEDFYEAVRYCFVELLRGQRQVGNLPPVAVAGHWNISVRGPSRCLRFMRPY